MSHTVNTPAAMKSAWPIQTTETLLSGLTSGSPENVLHGGPSGVKPMQVLVEVQTRPTDSSVVGWEHKTASDSTTNNTASIRFYSSSGDLTGAVVKVQYTFNQSASGGISPSTNAAAVYV